MTHQPKTKICDSTSRYFCHQGLLPKVKEGNGKHIMFTSYQIIIIITLMVITATTYVSLHTSHCAEHKTDNDSFNFCSSSMWLFASTSWNSNSNYLPNKGNNFLGRSPEVGGFYIYWLKIITKDLVLPISMPDILPGMGVGVGLKGRLTSDGTIFKLASDRAESCSRRYPRALTIHICEHDLIWKRGLCRCSKFKTISVGRALVLHDWCPYKKRK